MGGVKKFQLCSKKKKKSQGAEHLPILVILVEKVSLELSPASVSFFLHWS